MNADLPHIVILGCGFGGLEAAKALARAPVEITLVDRSNHHLFQPLLYQVATAGLSAPAIAAPIRHIFKRQRNLASLMAEARDINVDRKTVTLDDGAEIHYDYLVVATGATHSYFGHDEWAPYAPGLKTLEDALDIRRRVLLAFEQAERERDRTAQGAWLTFVVIGAGPTGVEMAGTLAEIARQTFTNEFRHIDPRNARVLLLEGTDRVLSAYPSDLSRRALEQLERLGVKVRLNSKVTGVDGEGVAIGEERIAARTIIWAAGVAASSLGKTLGVALDRAGRVPVEPDLSIAGRAEVFVVGDLAAAQSEGKPVPGVSPAAKQMGRHAARMILARLRGASTRPFRYRDYGSLATIGRKAAVALIGRVKLWGFPAWMMWLCAHIYFLIGFRNRLVVMIDWGWAYFTYERGARIVTKAITTDPVPPRLGEE